MRNQDIVDLFELVPPGTGVSIAEQREAAAIE
jgi:lipoprotein-anchoring transpeptidase ErfK/SrfK